MKIGDDYRGSTEETMLDVMVANALRPVELAAKVWAWATFGFRIYSDIRVGQNGELVEIPKTETLDENGHPLSPLALTYRETALDELPQLKLVLSGVMSMSAVGISCLKKTRKYEKLHHEPTVDESF